MTETSATIFVYLLDEGIDVWRPVRGVELGGGLYRLEGPVPEGEVWEYKPGEVVRGEIRNLSGGPVLVAVERIVGAR